MINIKRIDQKEPITEEFGMLNIGAMFVDLEDLDLMIKTSDDDAMVIDTGDSYGYDPECKVQLCNVDITYTPRYI